MQRQQRFVLPQRFADSIFDCLVDCALVHAEQSTTGAKKMPAIWGYIETNIRRAGRKHDGGQSDCQRQLCECKKMAAAQLSSTAPTFSPNARRAAAIVERESGGEHARRKEKGRREPRGFSQIHCMVRAGQQLYSRTMLAEGEAALIARTDSMRFRVMIPN